MNCSRYEVTIHTRAKPVLVNFHWKIIEKLIFFQTKRVIVYLGRAKPEKLVDQMMIELQVIFSKKLLICRNKLWHPDPSGAVCRKRNIYYYSLEIRHWLEYLYMGRPHLLCIAISDCRIFDIQRRADPDPTILSSDPVKEAQLGCSIR